MSGPLQVVLADSASQTDWSGGPGEPGPVDVWDTSFSESLLLEWDETAGSLMIDGLSDHWIDDSLKFTVGLCSPDINLDGYVDVLVGTRDGREIIWWENSESTPGDSWTKHYVVEGALDLVRALSAGDLDGDGDIDITANIDGVLWWENLGAGSGWSSHVLAASPFVLSCLFCADINGDGETDVVGAASQDDRICWWENTGGGSGWIFRVVRDGFDDPRSVVCADIDDDDDMDIVSGSRNDNIVTWWENSDGLGTVWVEHLVDSYVPAVVSVHADDMDGDLDIDILAAAYYAKEESGTGEDLTWWENVDGLGTVWSAHIIDDNVLFSCAVHAADLDGDSDTDVIGGTGNMAQCPSWYENLDGGGLSWLKHPLAGNWSGGVSMWCGDFDADSIQDVLGSAGGIPVVGSDLFWWDVLEGYASEGSLESSILYLGNDPGWDTIDWTSSEPPGTSVSFLVRSSDDPGSMGSWSDTLSSPCSLAGILDDYDSYFQYMAVLQTDDSTSTPVLEDITITWDPLGVEEPPALETALLGPSCNPVCGDLVEIRFTLEEPSQVVLRIFDVSGRLIGEATGDFPPGDGAVGFTGLRPGLHFVKMVSVGLTAIERFVVIQ
jgi:hypothetical protein